MGHLGDLMPEMPQGLLVTGTYRAGARLTGVLGLAHMVRQVVAAPGG